ncbi:von Willebrand factor type A domain [Parelaphostrongylus tenuis]|uniref:von Willebrand factor type A domain n=1 Tax=Parelaphostrongylus tenuis TaxID=148309 RepID=A0AAD5M020_PARTN|nr:von Willebrand factor type A domain [Parelaphostrongylus tenuis]
MHVVVNKSSSEPILCFRTHYLEYMSENQGPGSAPENVLLHADKPVTISVQWDPPLITNGNITKYIVYYTPLDDQDPAHQIGQVQSRPINEWITYHDTPDTNGTRKAELKDFVETDTAYAVVVQAINDDGPGPYSNQYTIRTMSRAREGPPVDLRVEPEGQRSALVTWKEPTNVDVRPIGYEIYYVPGDKRNAPYIEVSTGEQGVEGITSIDVLPGSQITVSCNATGLPLPSVKWIRGGTYEIDPSTSFSNEKRNPKFSNENRTRRVRRDRYLSTVNIHSAHILGDKQMRSVDSAGTHAQFSLQVANVTEDTTFNCVAQNPLGQANWTISVNLLPGTLMLPLLE